MSQMWICRAGCRPCALWSPSAVYGMFNICSSFHLLVLDVISMSSFLKGPAVSLELHVENECL